MYEEGNGRLSLNWGPLLIKIVILAIILFLAGWIFTRITRNNNKSSNTTANTVEENTTISDSTYINNITTMRDAAVDYFEQSKLPTKVGNSKKISLATMIKKKLVLDFTENGKVCDTKNSYAKVTKKDKKNYTVKVVLTCGNKTDFVMANIAKQSCPTCNTTANTKPSSSNSSTTVSIKVECPNGCTLGGNSTTRYYKHVKYSNWKDGYSSNKGDKNKQITTTTYNYCEYSENTYYTTSYISENSKRPGTYTYELQIKDIDPKNVIDSKIRVKSSSYFSLSIEDYETKINSFSNSPIYMTGNTGKNNVLIDNPITFKETSLKDINFNFNLSNIYLNGNYRTTVTLNVLNTDSTTPYYAKNINSNIYFVPFKFVVRYANANRCTRDTKENAYKYTDHLKTSAKTTVKYKHKTATYKWSTEKYLAGYEYTGEYKDIKN